jgi:hypothetical protein
VADTAGSMSTAGSNGKATPLFNITTGHESRLRFQVLMVTSMKMAVLWVVAPRRLTEVDQRF